MNNFCDKRNRLSAVSFKERIKRSAFFVFLLTLSLSSVWGRTAPTDTLGSVRGCIVTEDEGPMSGVLVRIMTAKDSLVKTGGMTDTLGQYRITSIPQGNYILCATFIGHRTAYQNFQILPGNLNKNLQNIVLESNDFLLDAAKVTATLPPVTVMEDTVSYNADAYQTPDGSMVADLIERIPGAEITDDGQIKINGKVFNSILINGKEFFGDDPGAVLKNLPANIIKRIKTYDRKSEKARISGVDDGEENNVLDLQIKSNMFNGWVGQVNGAKGNHDRYSSALNLNKFQEVGHFSLMGGANNVNNPPFSEHGNEAVNYSRASRPGLTASKGIGASYGVEKKKKYRISGNVRYNYSGQETQSDRHSETTYSDTNVRLYDNSSSALRKRKEFNMNFKLEFNLDSLTLLQIRPNFTYSKTDNESSTVSRLNSWNGQDSARINNYSSSSSSLSEGSAESINLVLNRKLSRSGRNISINGSYSYSNYNSESNFHGVMHYMQQATRNYNRYRFHDGNSHSQSYNLGMSYNEPIVAKRLFLQFAYSYTHRYSRSNRYGYQVSCRAMDSLYMDDINWAQIPVDTTLSSCTANNFDSHNFSLNLQHTLPKLKFNYGVRMNPRRNRTNYIFGQKMSRGILTQHLMTWRPNLNFKYNFTKHNSFTVRYTGITGEPNIEELQEVIDKSNPENVRYGNPNLKPSFTNQLNANFNLYGPHSHQSFVTNFSYNTTDNTTSNMVLTESSTGVRVSKLMNVSGSWNMNGNINFNTPLRIDTLETLTLSTTSSANYSERSNYNSTPLTAKQLVDVGITKDFMEITPEEIDLLQPLAIRNNTCVLRLRQNLSLRYKPSKGYLFRLGGGVNYYRLGNSVNSSSSRETFDYTLFGNAQLELPFNSQFTTGFNYTNRQGYSEGIQKNIFIWNAQVTKRLFKHNAGLLTFQIFDILCQRSNITRSISNLTITDVRSQVLRDYFLLSFQYRINTMMKRGRRN